MKAKTLIAEKYHELLELYGAQGWWPLNGHYHPGEYEWPKTKNQIFEIGVGAILTQNTAWTSVEIALDNLRHLKILSPQKLLQCDLEELKEAIRPSGYFNQKSAYLKSFTEFFVIRKGAPPTRKELLRIRGIGEETADSMLLYGWREPWFVVDAYTRRVFSAHEVVGMKERYSAIQQKFHDALEPHYEGEKRVRAYQEYHALIVRHAKRQKTIAKSHNRAEPRRKSSRM